MTEHEIKKPCLRSSLSWSVLFEIGRREKWGVHRLPPKYFNIWQIYWEFLQANRHWNWAKSSEWYHRIQHELGTHLSSKAKKIEFLTLWSFLSICYEWSCSTCTKIGTDQIEMSCSCKWDNIRFGRQRNVVFCGAHFSHFAKKWNFTKKQSFFSRCYSGLPHFNSVPPVVDIAMLKAFKSRCDVRTYICLN